MYEPGGEPPIPALQFYLRLIWHVLAALGLALVSLLVGMAGYRHFEGLAWRDAFLNAAMLLGGMGPVDPPRSNDGKVFAGWYALFAGLAYFTTTAILFAPVGHRILHKFHWKAEHP